MSGNATARDRGFTYLGILFAVAFIGVGLSVVAQVWSVTARRADEQDLLFIGDSFRRAIESYFLLGQQYPRSLDELLLDTRRTPPVRHLRKIYLDPITRSTDWRLVTSADGAIIGVASQSIAKPLKVANFNAKDAAFDGAECYCDWEFTYAPLLRRSRGGIVRGRSSLRDSLQGPLRNLPPSR